MRKWSRYLVGVVAVTGLVALVTHAGAETCTLELKTVDVSARTSSSANQGAFLARYARPQSFFQQLGGRQGMISGPSSGSTRKFSEVIKKEPAKYVTDTPFRGVATLGSQDYGFVLDAAAPAKDEKEDEKKEADDDKKAEKKDESSGSILSALSKAILPTVPTAPKGKAVNFTRLYFDLNHNGDLTDDEVIEAAPSPSYSSSSMLRATFPKVDLTIEADGKKLDYAFNFSVYSRVSSSYSYANASLSSAAYREGEITLDGKKRRVVLIDFNSNGRFDDVSGINDSIRTSDGTVYPTMGDMLHIDPQSSGSSRNPYDATSSPSQYQVGKLIGIGERFFDLKIDPSGETLSLEPSSVPVGHMTNPNKGFRATVYGDQGMLQITPDDSGKALLPAGEWKLLSYSIEQAETPKPAPKAEKKDEKTSVLNVLSDALMSVAGTATSSSSSTRAKVSSVSASATGDFKPVKVVEGKTAEMRFGPPYKAVVSAPSMRSGQSTVSLSMSLVGTGGEVCKSLRVNGSQPSAPEFTISTKDGEEVAAGKFKYG